MIHLGSESTEQRAELIVERDEAGSWELIIGLDKAERWESIELVAQCK